VQLAIPQSAKSSLSPLSSLFALAQPENLMIDAKGYIKVIDFGFAKEVPDCTYTVCGTPGEASGYLARHIPTRADIFFSILRIFGTRDCARQRLWEER
jgi:serine/threonine protein kinase